MNFGHEKHIPDVMKAQGLAGAAQTCAACHPPSRANRDFEPLNFDRHCAACHFEGRLGRQHGPRPAHRRGRPGGAARARNRRRRHLQARGVRDRPRQGRAPVRPAPRCLGDVQPRASCARRASPTPSRAIVGAWRRASPPSSGVWPPPRRWRRSTRPASTSARPPSSARARERRSAWPRSPPPATRRRAGRGSTEVESGLRGAGDAAAADEVSKLRQAATAAGAGAAPLPAADFEARRQEVLGLLEAVETADPALKPRTEDLRRRIVALAPGENAADLLARVRDQRQAALERLRDEQTLRAQGVAPPRATLLESERSDLQRALADARAQLASLASVAVSTPLPAEERQRRQGDGGGGGGAVHEVPHPGRRSAGPGARGAAGAGARRLPPRAASPAGRLREVPCRHRGQQGFEGPQLQGYRQLPRVPQAFEARQDCLECHRFHPKAVP